MRSTTAWCSVSSGPLEHEQPDRDAELLQAPDLAGDEQLRATGVALEHVADGPLRHGSPPGRRRTRRCSPRARTRVSATVAGSRAEGPAQVGSVDELGDRRGQRVRVARRHEPAGDPVTHGRRDRRRRRWRRPARPLAIASSTTLGSPSRSPLRVDDRRHHDEVGARRSRPGARRGCAAARPARPGRRARAGDRLPRDRARSGPSPTSRSCDGSLDLRDAPRAGRRSPSSPRAGRRRAARPAPDGGRRRRAGTRSRSTPWRTQPRPDAGGARRSPRRRRCRPRRPPRPRPGPPSSSGGDLAGVEGVDAEAVRDAEQPRGRRRRPRRAGGRSSRARPTHRSRPGVAASSLGLARGGARRARHLDQPARARRPPGGGAPARPAWWRRRPRACPPGAAPAAR